MGELLDHDSVIREERESLKRLQTEWRDKFRQAEIEVSLERAQIARQKTELEQLLRELHKERALSADSAANGNHPPDKPVRGRWLAMLGLKNNEE